MRDRAQELAAAGCDVVGVSFDSPGENAEFATAQSFPFPLLSDVDHDVARRYETARAPDDRYAAFPLRISYLIDPDAVVRRSYVVTDVHGHADEVLLDLGDLRRPGSPGPG